MFLLSILSWRAKVVTKKKRKKKKKETSLKKEQERQHPEYNHQGHQYHYSPSDLQ